MMIFFKKKQKKRQSKNIKKEFEQMAEDNQGSKENIEVSPSDPKQDTNDATINETPPDYKTLFENAQNELTNIKRSDAAKILMTTNGIKSDDQKQLYSILKNSENMENDIKIMNKIFRTENKSATPVADSFLNNKTLPPKAVDTKIDTTKLAAKGWKF